MDTSKRCSVSLFVLSALALWLTASAVGWAGGAGVVAMSGAGTALPDDLGAVVLNPASAAKIGDQQVHGTFNLSADSAGISQLLLYAEPDSGYGAGILGMVRSRTATSYDAVTNQTLFDRSSSWRYVVAKELLPGTSVGGRLIYENAYSEEHARSGYGYRIDAGVVQQLAAGIFAGARIQNVLGTGVRWSDGASVMYDRSFSGGLAYVGGPLTLAVDATATPTSPDLALSGGAALRFDPVEVRGGLSYEAGVLGWSAGGAISRGPWSLEYAYEDLDGTHRVGVTWAF